MRRVLLGVVLVLGGWTSCQPVTGGEPMAGPTTAGLAALIEGEGWHYVGETGEPAFETGWDNLATDFNLAFRIREAGIVDIQGSIAPTSSPASTNDVFTLPEGYRPSDPFLCPAVGYTLASPPTIGALTVPIVVAVGIPGVLTIYGATDATYPVFGNTSQPLNEVFLNIQMFLTPPSAP